MIKSFRVLTTDVDYADIVWEFRQGYDPLDYTMRLLRSEAQFGMFEPITSTFKDRYRVRDTTIWQMYSRRRWFYRLEITRDSDSQVSFYPEQGGESADPKPDLEALEMAREYQLMLNEFIGRDVWIFPRRTFGTPCTCVDPTTRQRIVTVCTTCYGTMFIGGYQSPVRTKCHINIVQSSSVATDQQKRSLETAEGGLALYPFVREGDLIVEAENRRWEVNRVTYVRKLRAMFRQDLFLEEQDKASAVYLLPINEDIESLLISPPRQFTLHTTPGGSP